MKVAVVICSRGRPLWLQTAIASLWRTRSGRHDLAFVVGLDEDDAESIEATEKLSKQLPVLPSIAPRCNALGQVWNRVLQETKEADIVSSFMDRAVSITPGWDAAAADAFNQFPDRVIWWTSPQEADCTLPVWPKVFLDAIDYRWSSEIFPFWFDDTWLMEVDAFVSGPPVLKAPFAYATERGKTTRGRDFEFWGQVFQATRPQRIEQARKICEKLGKTWTDKTELADFFANESKFYLEHCGEFEQRYGDPREPDAGYLAAKLAASDILKEAA